MNDEILQQQISDLIDGTISEGGHRVLQDRLKSDSAARDVFRERMDLEAGLRTWAADSDADLPGTADRPAPATGRLRGGWRPVSMLVSAAALILVVAIWWTQQPDPEQPAVAEPQHPAEPREIRQTGLLPGILIQQTDCVWQQAPALQDGRFTTGPIELASGAAELRFDSGTNVVLEGPCRLEIQTADSARLLAGTVFVDVSEVSNGFLLETPEARIIDEGTQYAVALDSASADVHVFDGSVIWRSAQPDSRFEDRITSGEARRYSRSRPGRSHHIPFGQRQFVRRIEQAIREAGGDDLRAYDGFENLAGRLRRGRSGFGWAGGWEPAGRGRGSLAQVTDAPEDIVFGMNRSGRRLLSLRGGDSLRRPFEKPVQLSPGTPLFVSLLISRQSSSDEEDDSSIQIALEPASASPRFTRRHSVSFGVTSDGRPFVNNAGTIDITAVALPSGDPHLLILRYEIRQEGTAAGLRVFQTGENVDTTQPALWTVNGTAASGPTELGSIRISLAPQAQAQVDELRIGESWNSVVSPAD